MVLGACGLPGSGDEVGTDSDGATDSATAGATSSDTGLAVGDAHGVLNFTFYPATASGFPPQLGMAGAWRSEPFTTEDFFAVQAWGMHLPPPPVAADTVENHGIPVPYEWGKADTWVLGGNALKLRHGGDEALACLLLVDDTFPVYLSDDADFFDPACAPDPARWIAGATYDLIAFGGEGGGDVILHAAVTAPSALTVSAPDVATSLAPLDRGRDLALAWEASGEAGDRVIIRVIDIYGQVLVAHATDDGAFTIPAAEIGKLAAGPATLTIARERVFDLGLPEGDLRVVVRHEVWADPDLI